MPELTIKVTGMHCGSCAMLVDETLEELPGVTSSRTSFEEGRTVVDHDAELAPPAALAAAIAGLGYEAETPSP